MRSDSTWSALTTEQRDMLEGWLFEEHLGYREALERVQKEFGIAASMASLGRLYQQMANERMQKEFVEVKATAGQITESPLDWEQLAGAGMALVAKRLIQLAVESPGKVKEMGSLARVLLANEAILIKKRWVEFEEDRMDKEVRKALTDMEARKERMLAMEALLSVKSQPMPAASVQPYGGTPDGERRRA